MPISKKVASLELRAEGLAWARRAFPCQPTCGCSVLGGAVPVEFVSGVKNEGRICGNDEHDHDAVASYVARYNTRRVTDGEV